MTQSEQRRKETKGKIFEDLKKVVTFLVTEIEKDCGTRLGNYDVERANRLDVVAWAVYGALFKETRNSFQYDYEDIMRKIEKCWNV